MKRALTLLSLLGLGLCVSGCERETTVAPDSEALQVAVDPEAIAQRVVAATGWPVAEGQDLDDELARHPCTVQREPLIGDIVHYSFDVRVGHGPFDVIGIHRVVKERRPYRPIRTDESILMVHGSTGKFENGFLRPVSSVDLAISVFLAENDVDVWGIDLGWSLVPFGTEDFSFMEDWGLEKDAHHVGSGLAVARFTRLLTGSGWKKMHLLGHSLGGRVGYVLLGAESQLPAALRQVSGFIPVDIHVKTDSEEIRTGDCERAAAAQADIDAGVFASGTNETLATMGGLARNAPDDPSPVVGWLDNFHAALLVGTSTFLFSPLAPDYHLLGGVFDEGGYPLFPEGLQYTSIDAWLTKLEGSAGYVPRRINVDSSTMVCNEVDSPLDDHLGDITVPVLYVGAAGGVGEFGIYSTTVLGSTDITTLVVQLHPSDERGLDYGHNDLFTADNAVELVHQPILNWIEAHSGH